MPALKNAKHEAFCQLILQGAKNGWTQGECYQRAGYRASGHAAEVAASRVMKNVDIRQRLNELAAPAVRKTRATVDTLADQFDAVFDGAMGNAQFGAAGSAAAAKAKLLGFMREKIEVGGPGEFDNCETKDDVISRMISLAGSVQAALDQIDEARRLIAERAAEQAVDVTPPTKQRRSEAAKALEIFQPGRRIN
jgi:hypothetical protein